MGMTLGDVHFFTGLVVMKLCKEEEDKTVLGRKFFEVLSRVQMYEFTRNNSLATRGPSSWDTWAGSTTTAP